MTMPPISKYTYILSGLLLLLTACAPTLGGKSASVYRDDLIKEDMVWSGQIFIDGTVKVAKGATLTISPGTDIRFVRKDADKDGLGDAALAVEGRLIAIGSRQQPIRFRSAAENPQPGDWLEIKVDFSQEVHLKYCEIRDSAYTLHAHFTKGLVEDCTIHHNIDGCRLGQARFVFRNNLIENNQGKGINFRNSTVEVHHNIIRNNGSGVFLFENDREFSIHHNNFYGNLENFRLGDFYTGDVALQDNWWGAADLKQAKASIYDRSKDPEIGTVSIKPQVAWISGTGPRDDVTLIKSWTYATGGYIDADLVTDAEKLYVASWDGKLHVMNVKGRGLYQRFLGDVIDVSPVIGNELIYLQTWSREVYALETATGETRWRFDYSPSRADDHRQGSLLLINDMVLVPAWNGTLFALDALTGSQKWNYAAGQPLRSQPVSDGTKVYLASGNGRLSVLNMDGSLAWQMSTDSPLLRSPLITPAGAVVTSREGRVFAFDRSGNQLWQQDLKELCYYGASLYHDGEIFIATAGNGLWKLDVENGAVIWRQELAGPTYASPHLHDGRLYIGDNSGTLQVFGSDSADLLWSTQLDREIQGQPLIWGNHLLVGSRDHQVHAYQLSESTEP